jgi:SAM-dependent methyltransferase
MNDELIAFYAGGVEARRLSHGIAQLEFVRTCELLEGVLPQSQAVIYDVGGGTGRYASWLAGLGHLVHLLDPVPEHINTAANARGLASATVGDARALPWPDMSGDTVLLMGPLYHLLQQEDRVGALREARRVVKVGGLVFGVIIPRWASTLVGMLRGWIYDVAYANMVQEEITTGRHRRPNSWPPLLMDAFFHTESDIELECAEAGLVVERCVPIEGPAWMSQDFDASWQDPPRRQRILEVARLAEKSRDVLGASPHLAVICRRTARPL